MSTLYIKNPAAHKLAEKVSKKMGVTLTEAVIRSLEAQLAGTGSSHRLEEGGSHPKEGGRHANLGFPHG